MTENKPVILSDWRFTADDSKVARIYDSIQTNNVANIIITTSSENFNPTEFRLMKLLYPNDAAALGDTFSKYSATPIASQNDKPILNPLGFFAGTVKPLLNWYNPDVEGLYEAELPLVGGNRDFKTMPISYVIMAQHLKIDPSNIIVIDDDEFNRKAAAQAGCVCFDPATLVEDELLAAIDKIKQNWIEYDEESVASLIEVLQPKKKRQKLLEEQVANKNDVVPETGFLSTFKKLLGFKK